MRHLLFLSGGPDSTYSLRRLLTTTNDPVVVCYVTMNDQFGRVAIELHRVDLIVAYCRAIFRDFEFKRGSIMLPSPYAHSDVTLMAPFAAALINGYGDIGKLWMGCDLSSGGLDSCQEHFRRATKNMMFEPRSGISFPAEQYPDFGETVTKQKCRLYLGETLWKLTWSCRKPSSENKPCELCFACIARNKTRGPHGK